MSFVTNSLTASSYADPMDYMGDGHFFATLLLAIFLHITGATIYYLIPTEEIEVVPVKVLSVKLGGKVDGAAITSEDVNRLFAKRRLAQQQAQVAPAPAPVKKVEAAPAKPVVEKRVEPKPTEPKKAPPPAAEKPKPKVEQFKPKPKAKKKVTPPPPKPKKRVVTTEKLPKIQKTAPKPKAIVSKAKPKRYVRASQLTAIVGGQSNDARGADGAGSIIGNSKEAQQQRRIRYTQTVSLWIDKHKVYPESARASGEGGKVILRLRINREGKVLRYMLEQSSGSDAIDRAISQMIDAANPLPAVPDDYPDKNSQLEFLIPINFIP